LPEKIKGKAFFEGNSGIKKREKPQGLLSIIKKILLSKKDTRTHPRALIYHLPTFTQPQRHRCEASTPLATFISYDQA
jgi:hypothetical protein